MANFFRFHLVGLLLAISVASAAWAGDDKKSAPPESQKLPFKQQADTEINVVSRVIGGLIVVILIGYGGVYAMKKYFPSVYGHSTTGQRKINVIETRRLTPKATLFLVEVDGVRLLLAQSGDRITNLHQAAEQGQSENARE